MNHVSLASYHCSVVFPVRNGKSGFVVCDIHHAVGVILAVVSGCHRGKDGRGRAASMHERVVTMPIRVKTDYSHSLLTVF
jgi:hypothetical protein